MARPWERYSRDRFGQPSPMIQGPEREPPPRWADEVARQQAAEERARAAEARAAAAEARAAESHRLQMQPNPALTEGGRMARGFYERALRANEGYGQGVEPRGAVAQTLIDVFPESIERSWFSDSARRSADTYADEFIAATLRRESGAAIPEEEREAQYRRYFPVPGDTEEQIQIKAQLRQNALDALYTQAFGNPPERAPQPAPQQAPQLNRELPTQFNQRPIAPGQGGQMQLSDDVETRANPSLAGLNQHVAGMIQSNRPTREILSYLRERGFNPTGGWPSFVTDLNRLRQWRRQNPNYRGPLEVNLENYDQAIDPSSSSLNLRDDMAGAANSRVGAAAVAAGNIVTGGHLDNMVGLAGGDAEMANLGIQELRNRYPGSSIAGDIVGGAGLYGAGRAAAGAVARGLGRSLPSAAARTFGPGAIGSDAAMGAYIGSGQNGTDPISGQGMLAGGAGGAIGGVAGRGAINSLARAVSPTGGRMAPLYAEGVQPTLGQRVGGAMDRFEQAITSVPFLGGIPRRARNQAIEQFQRGAFNQALRDIGQELPRGLPVGTKAQAYMQRAFNREFTDIRRQMRFSPDQGFNQEYGTILRDVALLPKDSQNAFRRLMNNEQTRLRNGALTGNDYVRVTSRLSAQARAIRKNPRGDHQLADAYEAVAEAMDTAAARQSGPEIAERLMRARQGYRKSVVIEDAARRRGTGNGEFSPSQFDAAVQNIGGGLRSRAYLRGDAPMQPYGEAGLNLGDTLANSGTWDRILASGAVGTAGLTYPPALVPAGLSMLSTAPGVRNIVNAALAPNRPGLLPVRRQLEERARLGGLFGAPLALGFSQ